MNSAVIDFQKMDSATNAEKSETFLGRMGDISAESGRIHIGLELENKWKVSVFSDGRIK